tara:strand:+ start:303 stop:728 length:426 start_codon:yes stop_codon:yes gene_type:complete
MHSFNPKYAKTYGLQAAVILQHIIWWVLHNEAKGINKRDGKYWTFNSVRKLTEYFPFLTQKQVRTALLKLEARGAIVTGNYNKFKPDRTKWYSVHPELMLDIKKDKTYKIWKESHLPKRADQYQFENNNINKIELKREDIL